MNFNIALNKWLSQAHLKNGLKTILKMNNKKKLNLRIEYINHTGIHYLDNLPKYCDYLEAKLIEASNISDLNDLEELKKYLKFNG